MDDISDKDFDTLIRQHTYYAPSLWERIMRAVGRLIGRLVTYSKG